MSRRYEGTNNRQTKTHFGQYLFSPNEPKNSISDNIALEADADLLEDIYAVKMRIRRMAQSLRAN